METKSTKTTAREQIHELRNDLHACKLRRTVLEMQLNEVLNACTLLVSRASDAMYNGAWSEDAIHVLAAAHASLDMVKRTR